jgi:hypothetical protein
LFCGKWEGNLLLWVLKFRQLGRNIELFIYRMLRTCFQNGGKVDNLSGPMKFGLGMTLLGLGFDS